MAGRETFLNVSDQVVAAPGPGHYDINAFGDGVKVKILMTVVTELGNDLKNKFV